MSKISKRRESRKGGSSSKKTQSRVLNRCIPPYRKIRVFVREKTIAMDFDFYSFIHDYFGEHINKRLSGSSYKDIDDLFFKADEKGWVFHEPIFTHTIFNWACDHRLFWMSRAIIKGQEYSVFQWESLFIFVKDSQAYDQVLAEGIADATNFLKKIQ